MRKVCFLIFIALNTLIINARGGISPIQMGLWDASSDIERYWALYQTHIEALRQNVDVDYSGIRELRIEIPKDAKSIPLTNTTDFKGLKLTVVNHAKDMFLFELVSNASPINVHKSDIDKGRFLQMESLKRGSYLLVIEDQTPWVKKRVGYSYGATRKDVLVIKNGHSLNKTISKYDNPQSSPQCSLSNISENEKSISNILFIRGDGSQKKSFFLKLCRQYNVTIANICVSTPKDDSLYVDRIFFIEHCAKVRFSDITINGTYSLPAKYGYGILMDNVFDSRFTNLNGNSNWGIFGTNNINDISLLNCNINRFDIHCYGRDVYCKGCVFKDSENSMTSVFGTIKYVKCKFINSTPMHIDQSFDVYTPYDLIMEECEWQPTVKRNCIVMSANLLKDNDLERRCEIRYNQWPSVKIKGLNIVKGSENISEVFLFVLSRRWYDRLLNRGSKDKLPAKVRLIDVEENGIPLKRSNIGNNPKGLIKISSTTLVACLIILYISRKRHLFLGNL